VVFRAIKLLLIIYEYSLSDANAGKQAIERYRLGATDTFLLDGNQNIFIEASLKNSIKV